MRTEFLPFSPPYLGDEEIAAVTDALRSGWISRGPKTAEFETRFADFVGAPAALGLNSCTAGLHLAVKLLGIGPGDEVIVPTWTFCASANVVEHVGARPVIVDVQPDTLNLDPAAAEAAITPRTRAIMAVHFGGHPVDMAEIEALAERHDLAIIEDAAHALPATYRGQIIGGSNNLCAFSFYATKNLTTGEGGMLTGPSDLIDRARVLGLHGMSGAAWERYQPGGSWFYEVVEPGFKYNMTDIQAALGLVQLDRLPWMQERRGALVERYRMGLEGEGRLTLPSERPDVTSARHLFPVRLADGYDRNRCIAGLHERKIGTSVHFIPLHVHPFYRDKYGLTDADYPVASDAFGRLISLPLYPGLTDQDIDDVVEAISGALDQA